MPCNNICSFEQIRDYYQEAVKLLDDNGTSQMGSTLRKVLEAYVVALHVKCYRL